ncbi:MAG: MerR family transcriptional regulator [Longicatena sp.]
MYTIKDAQKICNISRKAIRYYIQEGLIQVSSSSKGYVFDQDTLQTLRCIHIYREYGMDVQTIKQLLKEDDKDVVVHLLEYTYQQVHETKKKKEENLVLIAQALDKLTLPENHISSFEDIGLLNDPNIVVETVMLPFRRFGSYYRLEDIAFTRRESKWLHIFLRLNILFIAIILLFVIILRWNGVADL